MEIKSNLHLPFRLIDVNTGNDSFVFEFKEFDKGQTDFSIKNGGLTGKFGIIYRCIGIECQFECDITIGNVYYFYIDLENAYDIQFGKNIKVILKDYSDVDNRTCLTFEFDKTGHCIINGYFKNKFSQYMSGVEFSIEIDQTYIAKMLVSFEMFFNELKRIQGDYNFM